MREGITALHSNASSHCPNPYSEWSPIIIQLSFAYWWKCLHFDDLVQGRCKLQEQWIYRSLVLSQQKILNRNKLQSSSKPAQFWYNLPNPLSLSRPISLSWPMHVNSHCSLVPHPRPSLGTRFEGCRVVEMLKDEEIHIRFRRINARVKFWLCCIFFLFQKMQKRTLLYLQVTQV